MWKSKEEGLAKILECSWCSFLKSTNISTKSPSQKPKINTFNKKGSTFSQDK
jgi:hypothetical protein